MDKDRVLRIKPITKARARELRDQQTSAEAKLWTYLRRKQLQGYSFRRQHPIGPFIVDFYCSQAHLVVEVDGDNHAAREDYDSHRTEWLMERGYRVVRFSNHEVFEELEGVLEGILRACGGAVE